MDEIISIVMPCYNHGHFIREAIESVNKCDSSLYELIIINDGSTDPNTIKVLEELSNEGYRVINQQNQGLSKTRNNGIALAKGKYILPLDSDNKIYPEYISYSLKYLQENKDIDVVYSDVELFGNESGIRYAPDFNLQHLMIINFIDACAVHRKSAWERIGGYDTNMKLGVEDWEYWLRMAFSGSRFHHVNRPLFSYRVADVSMITKDTKPNYRILKQYIEDKHPQFLNNELIVEYMVNKFKANPLVFCYKLLLKSYFPKSYKRLARNKSITPF